MGSIAGSIVGGITGPIAARRAAHGVNAALNSGKLASAYPQLADLLLPYEDLVSMGRLRANSGARLGLGPGDSRFSQALGGYEGSLTAADPVFGQYQKTLAAGLDQGGYGGLPSDFTDRLLQDVRGGQAARGVLDSGTSGIEEAVALMGGREAIRNQRLNQAQGYLSGFLMPAAENLVPSISTLYTGELQRAFQRASGVLGAANFGNSVGQGSGSLTQSGLNTAIAYS